MDVDVSNLDVAKAIGFLAPMDGPVREALPESWTFMAAQLYSLILDEGMSSAEAAAHIEAPVQFVEAYRQAAGI